MIRTVLSEAAAIVAIGLFMAWVLSVAAVLQMLLA